VASQEDEELAKARASDVVWAVMEGTALATGAEFFPAR
jgi:hypothetical protein